MYVFEGKDYSKNPSAGDEKSFDELLEQQLAESQRAAGEGRALRHKAGVRHDAAGTTHQTPVRPRTSSDGGSQLTSGSSFSWEKLPV